MTVTIHPNRADVLSEAEIEGWRAVPVAVAVDLVPGEQLDALIRPLNPAGKQPKLFGRAVTALCEPPDFGAVPNALEQVGPGEVLVIAAGGDGETAMIGEVLGGFLHKRGCAGLVCDGAIRDVGALAGWDDFSVFTRFVTPRGPTAAEKGSVNAPVKIGERLVSPGDLIMGDDDGLIVLSPATVRTRLADAQARLALESEWVAALAGGNPVVETLGFPPATLA